jgi:hypothetical protein
MNESTSGHNNSKVDMATSVIAAFNEFMKNKVNLDTDQTALARRSRDWLTDRIHEFPDKDSAFPRLYSEMDIFFGSFERKTKKRLLDDIDIMICMGSQGAIYNESIWNKTITVSTSNEASPLYKLRHDYSNNVHSKKIINKFVTALSGVDQYKKAEISRRGEAAILNLSYDWTFDIVPCFHTIPDADGKQFYVIPDGEGNWQKTDPSIDRARAKRIVQSKGKEVLGIIRLVKFWNKRPTMPSVPSYTLENMVLDYYETRDCSQYPDYQFRDFILHMATAVYQPVNDPKGFQGDLNTLEPVAKRAIYDRCMLDHAKCVEAVNFEVAKDYKRSISKWTDVFGPEFTTYG